MPARRTILRGLPACAVTLSGCLSRIEQVTNGDGDTGAPGDGDSPEDGSVVHYEDLSESGRTFVDAAIGDSVWSCDRGGHVLRSVIRDDERVYVERDPDTEGLVQADDPLTLESVDNELEGVFHDGTYLEIDGRTYESHTDNSAGPYRSLYAAEDADDCDEVVQQTELSGTRRELANALLDEGEAWVAEERDAPFAAADVYYDEMGDFGDFVSLIAVPDGACLEGDDRSIRLRFAAQDEMFARTYCLARRPPTGDT